VGGPKSRFRGFEDPNFFLVHSVACRVSGDVLNGHHEQVKTCFPPFTGHEGP